MLYDWLNKEVKDSDAIAIARAASSFNFFLTFHLNKEDAHLYKIFDEKVSISDQWPIIGKISQGIPRERIPEVVSWLFPLIEIRDRENMVRIYQKFLPAPALTGVIQLIKSAIGDDWAELTSRIPELN